MCIYIYFSRDNLRDRICLLPVTLKLKYTQAGYCRLKGLSLTILWISSLTFGVELDFPFIIEVNSGIYTKDYVLSFVNGKAAIKKGLPLYFEL